MIIVSFHTQDKYKEAPGGRELEDCAKLAIYDGDRDSTSTLLSVLQDNGLQPLYKAAYVMTASVQVNL